MADNVPTLDLDHLAELRELGDDFLHQMLAVFRDDLPAVLDQVQAHAANGQGRELARAAHRVCSSARNMGARALGDAAKDMELHAAQWPAAQAVARAAALRQAFAAAVAAIEAYLNEAGAV